MINVFIADDSKEIREGISLLISQTEDIDTCGSAADGKEIVRRAAIEDWDLLILDLEFPDCNGFFLLAQLKNLKPDLKVIIYTMYGSQINSEKAKSAGAAAFLCKDCPPQLLLDNIRSVYNLGENEKFA
jgi:DNA-binding NarL/FixJ family response regulator